MFESFPPLPWILQVCAAAPNQLKLWWLSTVCSHQCNNTTGTNVSRVCPSQQFYMRDNSQRGVHYQELMEDVEAWTVQCAAESINSWLWIPRRALSRLYHCHVLKKKILRPFVYIFNFKRGSHLALLPGTDTVFWKEMWWILDRVDTYGCSIFLFIWDAEDMTCYNFTVVAGQKRHEKNFVFLLFIGSQSWKQNWLEQRGTDTLWVWQYERHL